jgi:putative DNA primase/helicase
VSAAPDWRAGNLAALPPPRIGPGEGRVLVPWQEHDPRVFHAAEMPETDLGLGERFLLWHGQEWRYRPGVGWMHYDGQRWRPDAQGRSARAAMQAVVRAVTELEADALPAVAGDGRRRSAREQRRAWGRSCETPRRMSAALESAETLPGASVDEDAWDADPLAVNTRGGLLDLRSGLIGPHARDHHCTGLVEADYVPEARCAALAHVLDHLAAGDRDVLTFLARWLGYCLTGSMAAEAFLFLSGAPQSGKSTLLSAFTRMLGSYGEVASAESFAWRPASSAASPELARLAGKRFVYVPEAGGIRLDTARVKQIVGGDPIVARMLHQNPVTFRPQFKLAFTANELAVIPDDDTGLGRRLLPLRIATPVTSRDARIKANLEESDEGRAALLALAVHGARAWLRDGADLTALQAPRLVRDEVAEYLGEMDPLREWWEERIVVQPGRSTTTTVLHADYVEWARSHGVARPLGIKGFAQRLTFRGFQVGEDRTHGSQRIGLALQPRSAGAPR